MREFAIIGGGAAGMMAGARILELLEITENERKSDLSFRGSFELPTFSRKKMSFLRVHLFEKNKVLGRKVAISGGGRCNVTTGIQDLPELLRKYPRGANFLRSALYDFSPKAMWQWVEARGVKLKMEKDLRIFPNSDKGTDVVGIFERLFISERRKSNKVFGGEVVSRLGVEILAVKKNSEGFLLIFREEGCEKKLQVEKLLLATGGQAYRHTGSTGEGYKFAESLGHSITPLAPSLNAFVLMEEWIKNLAGVSLKNVKLKLRKKEFKGSIMFTHKGITGPAVFALSALTAYEKFSQSEPATLHLDFTPEHSYEELSEILRWPVGKDFLAKITTRSLANALKEISGNSVDKMVENIKNCCFSLSGRSPGEEFVTAGGVASSEVNPKTMQSKICPGLFFAGEILDVDGFTGGFNLQASWSTGRMAGEKMLLLN